MDRAASSSAGLFQQLVRGGAGALVGALDHLLEQNDWARQRLAMHAGRTILIGVDMPALRSLPEPRLLATVTEGGRLKRVDAGNATSPAVTMLLRPSIDAAFDFLRGGAPALSRHLRMEGDVLLAGALGEIVRHLRWDATEDLSRLTGDVVAERIARLASGAAGAMRDAGARIESGAARYLSVESGQLVDRAELEVLGIELDALEQRLNALSLSTGPERDPNPPGANLRSTEGQPFGHRQLAADPAPQAARAAPMPWASPDVPSSGGPYTAPPATPAASSLPASQPGTSARPSAGSSPPPTVP